jgi:diguanylate cyclase (GGDEF)-like protein
MDGIRQGWHLTAQALYSLLRVINWCRRALTKRFSLGITSRLVAAFIGVGALVLAANFIVEQGVLIEKTTEITRIEAPATAPKPTEVASRPTVSPPAIPLERRIVVSDMVMAALDRFGRSAQDRVNGNSAEVDAEYQQSSSELDRATRAFIAQAAPISGKPLGKLSSSVNAYREHGDDLIAMADNRHAMKVDYSTLFEQVYARSNDSLKGAWKVFGRVIARQSLLQLSADLDELRRSSAALESADSAEAPEIAVVLKTEQAVTTNLESNEKAFRRSEGDQWYVAMHDDFVRLTALRESIMQLNGQMHLRSHAFSDEAERVAALVPAKIEALVAVPAPKSAGTAGETGIKHAPNMPAKTVPGVVLPAVIISAPSLVPPHVVTTRVEKSNGKRRVVVACISVLVLVLLISIAFGTMLSIVRPVRGLRDAIVRVAKGDAAVRVERGGIKELDTLAVAFNAMAEELSEAKAAARDYQQSLEAKVAERTQQLRQLAECDPLTGLPNRRELFVLLNAAIERARSESYLVGVFFLDIDNFKYLNDSMGHAFGDRVLVSFARRLQEATRAFGFAARLGGDEFTVVFERAGSVDDIRTAGLSVVQAFQNPLSVDGRDIVVSVSVGASIYPDHEQGAEALLKAADAALFRAKALGRSQLSVFTRELLEAAAAKFTTEQGLRRAIERGEFELVFQPELHIETMEMALVEALIRWRMPDGSLATPGQFLAVAEESGLIMEISDWVLRSAVEAAAYWYRGDWPEARVAINVSPRQLLDNRFGDRLCELLRTHSLPTHCIEIELTESVLQTGVATIDALRALRAQGIAIALDDFGTGYSSLASLEQLPLTRIKLDRSLIAGIDTNPRSAAIARAIIGMCQGLGLEITAEGVERPEQFAKLMGYPGMYLQGYILSHPVSRDRVMAARVEVSQRAQELLLSSPLIGPSNVIELPPPAVRRVPEVG